MEELGFLHRDDGLILGVDEVGRGPLAGPVVTAATLLEFDEKDPFERRERQAQSWLAHLGELGIHDSKKLSPAKRRKVLQRFPFSLQDLQTDHSYLLGEQNGCRLWLRLAQLGPLEIDRLNILRASLEGMRRSSSELIGECFSSRENPPGALLIDGARGFKTQGPLRAIPLTKGDQRSVLIGLASIFAKEFRDHLMERYAAEYPGYGFAQHAGYPTATHRRAIENLGPCAIHRRSFKGVREFCSS